MSYFKVALTTDITAQSGRQVRLGRDQIAIFRRGDDYFAINDLCPHRGAPLSEGFVEQDKVFCPWHCFDFHLQTGESTIAPHLCVATYPVQVENGEIAVLYPDELVERESDWPED
ncbi:MAG: nitrite reductase small subunit NirD [Acidobacteriota bacterium]